MNEQTRTSRISEWHQIDRLIASGPEFLKLTKPVFNDLKMSCRGFNGKMSAFQNKENFKNHSANLQKLNEAAQGYWKQGGNRSQKRTLLHINSLLELNQPSQNSELALVRINIQHELKHQKKEISELDSLLSLIIRLIEYFQARQTYILDEAIREHKLNTKSCENESLIHIDLTTLLEKYEKQKNALALALKAQKAKQKKTVEGYEKIIEALQSQIAQAMEDKLDQNEKQEELEEQIRAKEGDLLQKIKKIDELDEKYNKLKDTLNALEQENIELKQMLQRKKQKSEKGTNRLCQTEQAWPKSQPLQQNELIRMLFCQAISLEPFVKDNQTTANFICQY